VSALYGRLAARRGKQRAIMAVAHSIMVSVFHMLTRQEPYHELGARYFDERRRHYTVDLSLSRFMVYCASHNRRHHPWLIYGSLTCRIAPRSSWI
jgi:hypothetical protein